MKITQIFDFVKNICHTGEREREGGGNSPLKSKSYFQILCSTLKNVSSKVDSNFFNSFRKRHSGVVLIEAAVTLPVVMYIMLFCLELVKIHLLQIAVDKTCAKCVYHLCSERTVGSFDSILARYKPAFLPTGYLRCWVRIYSSLENMMSQSPYGGEYIAFATDNENFYNGLGNNEAILKKYSSVHCGGKDIGLDARTSQLENGITKGYAVVVTVVARHKFSSAFIEKLFGGGTNTNKAGYYILWSRGSGIVNYANNGLAK